MSSRSRKILGLVVENTVLNSKNISSDYNSTEKSNHEKSQFANIQPLVPYDDTDGSLSDNENIVTGCLTTEEGHRLIQSSSNSSSSSASSLDSSDSSSSESSNCSPSSAKVNLLTHITQNVTVDELDSDGIVVNRRPRELKGVQNYYTSPLCTDESDVDLSDTDPTFVNIEPKRKRNYFFENLRSSSTKGNMQQEAEKECGFRAEHSV
ncbi:unnamed protein product [Diabrotica balteata]|uniref:Uncharacterized protein n=1 Tax=Diabrotica balteata TaxID=107213 RepID=A0A9N9XEI5_DIABA|nr:unnamed protein product [Diabrotica balteata]